MDDKTSSGSPSPPSSATTTCGWRCCSTPCIPGVGGVLVRGEKGTAKSTAVRALAALLPDVRGRARTAGSPATRRPRTRGARTGRTRRSDRSAARAARLVELPVGATEDRLVGSLDLERALAEGVRAYQPGLLADAHRGVLYVDEVNLLHDHLVDLLLDAAAMGRAHVERDGVSVSHAARFLLVGTMNPEEGELRPQLLDRFGLTVEVRASRDVDTRVEVVRRRMAFEDDPAGFVATFADAEAETARRIADARARLASVVLPDAELRRIAAVCAAFDVDGMRADLVIARAPTAHAAWRGRGRRRGGGRAGRPPGSRCRTGAAATRSTSRGGRAGARRGPARAPIPSRSPTRRTLTAVPAAARPDRRSGGRDRADAPDGANAASGRPDLPNAAIGSVVRTDRPSGRRRVRPTPAPPPSTPFRARRLAGPRRSARARPGGGRGPAPTPAGSSRPTHGTPRRAADAAPAGHRRRRRAAPARAAAASGAGLVLHRGDLRRAEREGREGNLVLFAVDASGSMAARGPDGGGLRRRAVAAARRLPAPRQGRAVTFRGTGAEVVLPPTSSVPAAQARLAGLRTGGRTPLADGLLRARRVLRGRAAARPPPPRPAGAAHRRPGHRRRPARAATRSATPAVPPRCWPPTGSPRSSWTARPGRSASAWPPGSPLRRPRRWSPSPTCPPTASPASCTRPAPPEAGHRSPAGPARRRRPASTAHHPPAPQPPPAGRAHRGDEGQVDRRVRARAARLEPGLVDRGVPVREVGEVEGRRGDGVPRARTAARADRRGRARRVAQDGRGLVLDPQTGHRRRPRRPGARGLEPRSAAGSRRRPTRSTCSTSSPTR